MRPRVVTLLILALSCTPAVDKSVLTERARQFFAAAARGDSAALVAMSVDSIPVHAALAAAKVDPNLFRIAADSLTVERSSESADTANFFFRIPRERIALGFVRRDTVWRVNHLGFPDRH